jgi:hypothetical protein
MQYSGPASLDFELISGGLPACRLLTQAWIDVRGCPPHQGLFALRTKPPGSPAKGEGIATCNET